MNIIVDLNETYYIFVFKPSALVFHSLIFTFLSTLMNSKGQSYDKTLHIQKV